MFANSMPWQHAVARCVRALGPSTIAAVTGGWDGEQIGAARLGQGLLWWLRRLRKVKLKYNDIRDSGAAAVAEGAGRSSALEVQEVSYNGIEDGGAEGMAAALLAGGCQRLEHLHAKSNRFTARGAAALAALVEGCPRLP